MFCGNLLPITVLTISKKEYFKLFDLYLVQLKTKFNFEILIPIKHIIISKFTFCKIIFSRLTKRLIRNS